MCDERGSNMRSHQPPAVPDAQLAEAEAVELLCVSTELYCANRQEARWRALVAQA